MDTVFVALTVWSDKSELRVLDWVLDHFESNKTKIVITNLEEDISYKTTFQDRIQREYLPKLRAKEFQAEILIPQDYGIEKICMELLKKEGMQKLVSDHFYRREVLEVFDPRVNFCCKIWFINPNNGLLTYERVFPVTLENAYMENEKLKKIVDEETAKRQKAQMEVERLKKIADENTIKQQEARKEIETLKNVVDKEMIKRKNIEEILLQKTEQSKLNEKRIDELKESWALSTNFNFQELKQATKNFSDSLKIGGGRFGSVYKGTFRGTTVAIKKFESQNIQEMSIFRQEIVVLSTVRHPNLVTLIGACSEPPALVYEFLSKGSLRNYLTNTSTDPPLCWKVRTSIIGEICLALIFLHSNKPNQIIHGDLKPDNIFLNANYTSKLCDFGPIKETYTDINASLPYIDPEFLSTGEKVSESDVYSFGVIILYLLTGKAHLKIRKTIEKSMRTGNFHTMIDVSAGRWPLHQAEEVAKIGIRCANVSRSNRPDLVNEVWPTIERLMKFPDEVTDNNPSLLGTSHRDN